MNSENGRRIYEQLGVKPLINAAGNQTVLGGSRLSPNVLQAMMEANRYYVDMKELLQRSGEVIADLLDAPAALVTSGCAAAITLGTAAILSGNDPEKIERLPNVTGIKHEVLIQKRQRYKYDRCVTLAGAKLIEVGDESGTTPDQLGAAFSSDTAAILYPAPGGGEGMLPLEEVIDLGNQHGVPVIVDAAMQIYPLEKMKRYAQMGAGVVGFGAKYFGGPNSTGLLCGRADLVETALLHSFIGFETSPYRTLGRPLKLDRQEVVAVVVALREWFEMDHEARFAEHLRKAEVIRQALDNLPHVTATPYADEQGLYVGLSLTLDEKAMGRSAEEIVKALGEGSPGITLYYSANVIQVNASPLSDGDEQVVAERLQALLRS